MGRADQLHAPLGDRARGHRLELGADLVDDDHLRHVVFDRLDHHAMLGGRGRHLHTPRPPDRRVGDVAIAGDFVGGVDDHHPLAQIVGQHPRGLPQHGRLADARSPEDQHALPRLDEVGDDRDRAVHGATDSTGEADDLPRSVANGGDTVERPFDAGAIVVAEVADALGRMGKIVTRDVGDGEHHLLVLEARHRLPPEIHDDLDQAAPGMLVLQRHHRPGDRGGQHSQQIVDRIGDLGLVALAAFREERRNPLVGHAALSHLVGWYRHHHRVVTPLPIRRDHHQETRETTAPVWVWVWRGVHAPPPASPSDRRARGRPPARSCT